MEILLNVNNFGQEPFYSSLKDLIRPCMRVLILPLSFHEDWLHNNREFYQHYGYRGEEFQDIASEFYAYHIKARNIRVLNYFRDDHEAALRKIQAADILFFTGGYPDRILYRLDELGLREAVTDFPGIVMGTSAGAMVQFDHYHVTPEEAGEEYEYHDGLGRLSGFDIEVHYEARFEQLSCMLIALKQNGIPIFALPNDSGLICDGDELESIGEVFLATEEDIDILQDMIDEQAAEAEAAGEELQDE